MAVKHKVVENMEARCKPVAPEAAHMSYLFQAEVHMGAECIPVPVPADIQQEVRALQRPP